MMRNNLSNHGFRDLVAFFWLISLLLIMPLWMGGTGIIAQRILVFSGLSLPLLLVAQGKKLQQLPGLLPLSLYCGWLLIQIVPLPPFIHHALAPGYAQLVDQGFWLLSPGAWRSLSLHPAATLNEFFRYTSYVGFYLATVVLVAESTNLRKILHVMTWFFGVYALLGLVQFFVPNHKVFWVFANWPVRTSHHFATFVNGNHYASLIGMIFPLLVVATILNFPSSGYGTWKDKLTDLLTDSELSRGMLFGVIAILAMVSVFFSLSRGGALSLLGSSFVLFVLLALNRDLKGKMLVFIVVLVAAIGLGTLFGWEPLMKRFSDLFYETGGVKEQRLVYWQDSINLVKAAPLTGSGAGTFVDAYPSWQSAKSNGLLVDHAHNDYVELITDMGAIGASLILWFWVSLFRKCILAYRRRKNKLARLVTVAAIAGLVAILFHSVTDFNLAIPANGLYLFLLFSLLVAASHNTSRSREGEIPELKGSGKTVALISLCSVLFIFVLSTAGNILSDHYFSPVADANLFSISEDQKSEVAKRAGFASAVSPLDATYPFAVSMASASLAKLDVALSAIKESLALRPFNNESLRLATRILYAMGDEKGAESVLKGAMLTSPTSWDVRREYADFLLESGRSSDGIAVLRQGLAMHPTKTSKVLERLILHGIKRKDMIYAMPESSYPLSVYGDFLVKMGDLGAAEQAYRRGVANAMNEPEPNAQVFWRYIKFLTQSKRTAEALELVRNALELFPRNPYFLSRQGVLYDGEHLPDRAIESYRASLLINPSQDWVRKRLRRLEDSRGTY